MRLNQVEIYKSVYQCGIIYATKKRTNQEHSYKYSNQRILRKQIDVNVMSVRSNVLKDVNFKIIF